MTEPLEASAAIALHEAASLCAPTGCGWYHGLYPVLRLLDLAPTPERHTPFYDAAFRALAATGRHTRVAVTGSADTCMPAHVLRAWRAEGAEPEVTVVERCATPLRICAALGVHTTLCDVLHWVAEEPFDVVTAHSFLGMFPHARQADVIARWRAALRPGGVAVSVNRVEPGWSPAHKGFSEDQARGFADLVRERVRARLPHADADALAQVAGTFGTRMRSYPFSSADALRTVLERGGFRVDRLDVVPFAGRADVTASGPGTHRPGIFAHFVATAV